MAGVMLMARDSQTEKYVLVSKKYINLHPKAVIQSTLAETKVPVWRISVK
jgi:hypothetical protein